MIKFSLKKCIKPNNIMGHRPRLGFETKFSGTSLVKSNSFSNTKSRYLSSKETRANEIVEGVKLKDLHKEWLMSFQKNNIEDPELSIQYIIKHIMNFQQGHDFNSIMEKEVSTEQEEQIRTLCECRLARMPVQYLIKEWDFRELRLAMVPPVFIPRPETEQLVDLVLKHVSPQSRFLEVGCGSGAICLSLLHSLPQAQVTAIDQSKLACQLTKKNAEINGLTKNLTVLTSKLKEDGSLSEPLPVSTVDVIVSNPPYVPSILLPTLQPEITLYEDLRALDGGRDGLRVVKALLTLSEQVLTAGGQVFLEVDSTHPPVIAKWLNQHPELNLSIVHTHKDYTDRDRFVHLKKS